MKALDLVLLLVLMDVVIQLHHPALGQDATALSKGFYSSSCPKAESIVRSTVESHFNQDSTLAAALLRLHFHDCFVQGCDGSILIDGRSAERKAVTNSGLRGFEVIDDAKEQLEGLCPGVVSCADILALAARDAVVLSGGPSWGVPTGRRDGRVSLSSETANLPSPLDSVAKQRQKFSAKGLDDHDLVTLTGNIRGLLGLRFNFEFPKAMIKMSSIDVKTGTQGEIRKICSKLN